MSYKEIAIYINKIVIHARVWVNLNNAMLNERKLTQMPHSVWFHWYKIPGIGKFIGIESRLADVMSLGKGRLEALGMGFLTEMT